MTRLGARYAVSAALAVASTLATGPLGCSKGPRPADPDPDGGSDTISVLPEWSAPGWELTWVVQAGGSDEYEWDVGDRASDLSVSPSGSLLVTGDLWSEEAVFGLGTASELHVAPPQDGVIFVASFDMDGEPEWVSTASVSGIAGSGIGPAADGGIVVSGFLETGNGPPVFGAGEASETVLDVVCDRCPFLARWEQDGSFAWVRSADGAGGYGVTREGGLAVLPDGSAYQVGWVNEVLVLGTGEEGETPIGPDGEGSAGYVARFAASGDLLWARRIHGAGTEVACWGAASTAGSGCLAGCLYQGSVQVEGGDAPDAALTAPGEWGVLIADYGDSGDLSFAVDLGLAGAAVTENGNTIAVSQYVDGGFLVASGYTGAIESGPSGSGEWFHAEDDVMDPFLMRFDQDGSRLWTAVAVGTGGEGFAEGHQGIAVLDTGEIVVGGCFSGEKTFGPGEPNETTISTEGTWISHLALYQPDGTLSWVIPVATRLSSWGGENEIVSGVAALGDGTIFAAGCFHSEAGFGTNPGHMTELSSYGQADIFLLRLDRTAPPN